MKPVALLLALLAASLGAEEVRIQKVFAAGRTVRLKVSTADCILQPSPDGRIHVDVTFSQDKSDYAPTFAEAGDALDLGEKHHPRHVQGKPRWTLGLPDGLAVEFRVASGSLKARGLRMDLRAISGSGRLDFQGVRGELRLTTGSGDIRLQDCDGLSLSATTGSGDYELVRVKGRVDARAGSGQITFTDGQGDLSFSVGSGRIHLRGLKGNVGASSGSGSIRAENLTLVERATFSTGSGDMDLDVPEGQAYRLTATTGSGDVTLNLNGKPPRGHFEFSVPKHHGRIVSPEAFDREEEIGGSSGPLLRKSFTRGDASRQVSLRTGSGRLELRR